MSGAPHMNLPPLKNKIAATLNDPSGASSSYVDNQRGHQAVSTAQVYDQISNTQNVAEAQTLAKTAAQRLAQGEHQGATMAHYMNDELRKAAGVSSTSHEAVAQHLQECPNSLDFLID